MTDKTEKIDLDKIEALVARWREKVKRDPEDILSVCFGEIDALLAEVKRLRETTAAQMEATLDAYKRIKAARNAALEKAAIRFGHLVGDLEATPSLVGFRL